ncbi:hypothetical protein [Natrialba sp. SSL1]|uniref:hypothetical protein n=1 Tax=Natrialba sp. SSL1 TaxID=1869245 RepID=UPI0011133D6E|nr:hypothetical protein [Natrialba sp. SSL1]
MSDLCGLVNKTHAQLLSRMLEEADGWSDDDMPDEVLLLASQAGVNEPTLRRAVELTDTLEVADDE